MQNSEFAYFSSKSGKHMKQMSNPPFWGDVGVKNSVICGKFVTQIASRQNSVNYTLCVKLHTITNCVI